MGSLSGCLKLACFLDVSSLSLLIPITMRVFLFDAVGVRLWASQILSLRYER